MPNRKQYTGLVDCVKSNLRFMIPPNTNRFIMVGEGWASTEEIDMHNTILRTSCWDDVTMRDYMSVGNLILAHERYGKIPIGKVFDYEVFPGVGFRINFGILDKPDGHEAVQAAQEGLLNCLSVGFARASYVWGDEGEPDEIIKCSLLEISLCDRGSNHGTIVDKIVLLNNKIDPSTKQSVEEGIRNIMPNVLTKRDVDAAVHEKTKDINTRLDAVDTTVKDVNENLTRIERIANQVRDLQENGNYGEGDVERLIAKASEDMETEQKRMSTVQDEIKDQLKDAIRLAEVPGKFKEMNIRGLHAAHNDEVAAMFNNDYRVVHIRNFQRLSDALLMRDMVKHTQSVRDNGNYHLTAKDKRIRELDGWDALQQSCQRVMYSTGVGVGNEWVPPGWSSMLKEKRTQAMIVEGQFQRIPVNNETLTVPAEGADIDPLGINEITSELSAFPADSQTPGTRNVTFTPRPIKAWTQLSHEMQKWSDIDMFDYVQAKLLRSRHRAGETGIINGQMTANIDTGVAANSVLNKLDGLRYLIDGISALKIDLGTWNGDTLNGLDIAMDHYSNPSECVYICSFRTYLKHFKMMDEVRTLDKFGDGFTVKSGAISAYEGKQIIPSQFVANNLNASGVYPGAGQVKSILLLVNTGRFAIGDASDFEMLSKFYPDNDRVMQFFMYDMLSFMPWDDLASETPFALGYNIS